MRVSELTPENIIAQERQSIQHFSDMARKAKERGDLDAEAIYLKVVEISKRTIERLESEMEHFNELTPSQVELLALLSEECGEVIQSVGKILRHGRDSKSPLVANGDTNIERLERELGHVLMAIELLENSGNIQMSQVAWSHNQKRQDIPRWMHHQEQSS